MSVNASLSGGSTFQKSLAFGQMAETDIAKWFIRRDAIVLPIYDIEYDTGKGPRLFGSDNWAAPDLLVWKDEKQFWIEAKHKTVFTWYRKKQQWETGIDLHHYRAYQHVAKQTNLPVWLLFLHRSSTPDARDLRYGSPAECPVGLFGNSLSELTYLESHRSNLHGRHGMVYWAAKDLLPIATLEEVTGNYEKTA